MTAHFVDTSALAKRYINEIGSGWLRGVLDPSTGARTFIVRTTAVELIAAITRRERGGSMAPPDATAARTSFRTDLRLDYQIVEVSESLIHRAMIVAETHGLRGYDAIQLAAALELSARRLARGLSPLLFLSSDLELLGAAKAEGLAVDDPHNHP